MHQIQIYTDNAKKKKSCKLKFSGSEITFKIRWFRLYFKNYLYFLVPSKLGYGSEGAAPDVPPNATLVFEVECKGVH